MIHTLNIINMQEAIEKKPKSTIRYM